jgi:two-component system cell cycle response regulator
MIQSGGKPMGGQAKRKSSPWKRILIVEDDSVSALLLRKVLEQKGYDVTHAVNGVEALEKFKESDFRVVISDWMMPEMDGIELCERLRKSAAGYVYVILLSAKSQREDSLGAYEAGVDDFLTKPLDREELLARLKVAHRVLAAEDSLRRQQEELKLAGERLTNMNDRLTLASRRFEELFSDLPVACFTFNREGLIHEWNCAAADLFGEHPESALMKPVWEAFKGRDAGFWNQELVRDIFDGKAQQGVDWVHMSPGHGERHLICNVIPMHGVNGEVLGGIATNQDITERRQAEQCIKTFARDLELQKRALEEANERLSALAVTDGLTGVWNHRRFREELENDFGDVKRRKNFSVVLIDVDHFKAFNDTFGHPAGDEVLKKVAEILQRCSRDNEMVARYGGEEFSIVLSDTDMTSAVAVAERMRQAIECEAWPLREITVSLGVATSRFDDESPEDALLRADAALYYSKENGRNRVSHFDTMAHQDDSQHLALKRPA